MTLVWHPLDRLGFGKRTEPITTLQVALVPNRDPPPYGADGDFVFGNVETDTFETARASEKFQAVQSDIRRGVELCEQTCSYFNYCGGGAPVNKYFENGRFDSTETMFCRFAKKAVFDVVLSKIESALAASSARPLIS